jgi:hypothetical protein
MLQKQPVCGSLGRTSELEAFTTHFLSHVSHIKSLLPPRTREQTQARLLNLVPHSILKRMILQVNIPLPEDALTASCFLVKAAHQTSPSNSELDLL